jgi:hypothetical protein
VTPASQLGPAAAVERHLPEGQREPNGAKSLAGYGDILWVTTAIQANDLGVQNSQVTVVIFPHIYISVCT